jgi:hypothetical protein
VCDASRNPIDFYSKLYRVISIRGSVETREPNNQVQSTEGVVFQTFSDAVNAPLAALNQSLDTCVLSGLPCLPLLSRLRLDTVCTAVSIERNVYVKRARKVDEEGGRARKPKPHSI